MPVPVVCSLEDHPKGAQHANGPLFCRLPVKHHCVQNGSTLVASDAFCGLCCACQVPEPAKRDELAGLFGLTEEEKADINLGADKQAEKIKAEQEEEAFF
jgi:hypothetical protein